MAGRYSEGGVENTTMNKKNWARYNSCSCHPVQWGLKKSLRRARRRVEKEIIAQEIKMNSLF